MEKNTKISTFKDEWKFWYIFEHYTQLDSKIWYLVLTF